MEKNISDSISGFFSYPVEFPYPVLIMIRETNHHSGKHPSEGDFFRSIYEELPVGIYRTNPQGNFLNFNPALQQILGYPDKKHLISVSLSDLYVDPDIRNQWMKLMETEGIIRDFEVQLIQYDGTRIWVKNTGKGFYNEDGQVEYYEGIVEDVTKQKKIEEELKKTINELHFANEKLTATEKELRANYQEILIKEHELRCIMQRNSAILDAIPDMMLVLSEDGEFLDKHFPEKSSSDSFREISKANNIRSIGLSKETLQTFLQKIGHTLESSELCLFEYELPVQGEIKYYESRLKTLQEHQVLVINRDITERVVQEQRIKAAISQIDKNIETLSTLNDKIRNPLTIINSLTDDIDPEIAEKINLQIKIINDLVILLDKGLIHSEKIHMFLMKHYVNPIKKLSEFANRISMGDFQVEIYPGSGDEVEELAESFRRMVNAFKIMNAMNTDLIGEEKEAEKNKEQLIENYVVPIKKLTEIANQASMGDLQAKIDVNTDNEIGDLAESFKRMINAFKIVESMNTYKSDEEVEPEHSQRHLIEEYVTPLQDLVLVANQVSMGDFDVDIQVKCSCNEIHELIKSFKRMINAFKIMEAMVKESWETHMFNMDT